MASLIKFAWIQNPYHANFGAAFQLKFHGACSAVTRGFARRCEIYMKEHARWDDRTGDARAGLRAEGSFELVRYTISLYHTVEYGIWLEVRWNGKYAIINPTIEAMGPRFMAEMVAAEVLGAAVP